MTKQQEAKVCLNCKFSTCMGTDNCPALALDRPRKSIKISLLRDLLLAGYDPAEVCFAVVEWTALI